MIGKLVADAWLDLLPEPVMNNPDYERFWLEVIAQRETQGLEPFEPNSEAPFNEWRDARRRKHAAQFPLGDNLFTLIFIVISDLTETRASDCSQLSRSEASPCRITRSTSSE